MLSGLMTEQGDLLKTYRCSAETLNTDNETIRERIEEDMDFKIPGLPHSVEARAKYQRSRIDSEDREPPKSTCSSTRPTTESII